MEPPLPQSPAPQIPATSVGVPAAAPKVPRGGVSFLVAVIIVLLGAGSVYGYSYYFGQQLSPEEVLKNMVANAQGIKTGSFSGSLDVVVYTNKGSGGSFGYDVATKGATTTLQVLFSGKIDVSDIADMKQAWDIRISVSTGTVPIMSGGMQFVSLGKMLYLKLNSVDFSGVAGGKPNPVGAVVSLFANQWFKLDTEAIAKTFLETGDFAARLKSGNLDRQNQLSPEKVKEIQELAKQFVFLKATQTLAGETLDGQSTYHYRLTLDKDALVSFMVAAMPILSEKPFPESALKEVRTALDAVRVENIELWIGKKDFRVRKLTANVSIVSQFGSGRFTLNESISGINQPVAITAPEGAKDANQILGGFLGGMTGRPPLAAPPGTVKPL
ncbi:MAG: hypothetical protein HYY10_04445 [Candidatus Liptonbacteria bacterium]|nr:hypothetical protein [Candidatus Liptonbacteria bacterium]